MGIAAWLRELGLERYEQAFRENDITSTVLPELTDQDLKDLGVSLGHRRLLLKAIRALADDRAGQRPAESAHAPDTPPEPVPRSEAERRQLTVLFCDLVGSTELSARLDPEDMGAVIRGYQQCCAEVVERWGGHVAKYMGDGVLAYFGWPQAHEDEAERAVRAGLALIDALAGVETPAGEPLAARVGIATGLVMVGELIGEGAAREEAVVGETPNLAARLQTLAAPGSVVISQVTRRLVGGLFDLADLGPVRGKGFAAPLIAWRVASESQTEGRFEARQTAGLTPLVGRDEEIALLLRRWQQAKDGEGHVVLMSGEPGIGKSRLVRELRARLKDEPHIPLFYQCSPYHTTSPLHPLIEQLERAAGFARDDPPATRIDKLEALLARGTDRVDQAVPLIAALLGLSTEGRYPALDLTPQRQKQLTLAALVDQLEGLAAAQPVLLAYEDMHWSDPTTQELLGLTIERLHRLPVLLLITYRPEFTPPWPAQPHVSALALSRLGRREGAALVERVVRDKALPDEVAAQIVAKTDGVPLFVEELTKTVLELGLLTDAGDHYELAGPLPPLALPSTLHDSLLARLDRLAPVKEIAQIGAALGREFSHALIAAVADRPEPELQAALDQLVAAELVYRRGAPPDVTYSFKHALVQDAAYQSLLRSRRQGLHAKIAAVIEVEQPTKTQQEPELLARHLTQAAQPERAIGYWRAAAQRASERSAYHEAGAHLRKSLELLSELPEAAARDGLELQLQISLGSALVVIHGFSSSAAEAVYVRARELAQKLDDQAQLFKSTWGLWLIHQTRVQVTIGRALAEELLIVAARGADVGQRLEAHHAAWTTLLFVPDLVACRTHTRQGLALYDPEQHSEHKFLYGGHDAGVCGLHHRGVAEWLLGFPDQALEHAREALSLARALGHGPSLLMALNSNAYQHRCRGELAAARERSEEQVRLCVEQEMVPQHVAWGRIGRGWAIALAGDLESGLAGMREGLDQLEAMKVQFRRAHHLALFAEVCALAGRVDEGRLALEAALESAERWWLPEVHRLRGGLALAKAADRAEEAEQWFQRALAEARAQQARSLELRAASSLARLWRDQGRRAQAHDLLAPVYGWFTEGFETADLKEAKALLDDLS